MKLIEEVESYSFFDESMKEFTDSVTVRNLHLESLQLLHAHCTDVKTELYSTRRYKDTHFQMSMISFHKYINK